MFDPKITEGPWDIIKDTHPNLKGLVYSIGNIKTHGLDGNVNVLECDQNMISVSEDDAKAISAVPDLLDIQAAANNFINAIENEDGLNLSNEIKNLFFERLKKSIEKLEVKHCT